MEDEGGVLLDGKALGNLRVVDLKQELEKRGLSKSGSKKDLVKRLKQQLEFEKLCGERKSTGDCDLKLELDADTEQNEFVQQYLAQQQKIYAEQKEVKRLIELEEIHKSGDERGSDSPKAEDASDHDTRDTSDNESPHEVSENVQAVTNIQKSENKIDDVDSSKIDEDDSRQKEVKEKDHDSEKIDSPIKGGNIKQTTEAENPLSKIKAEEISTSSETIEEKAMTKVSKIEVVGTKNTESSNQIKSVENVGAIDHEFEVEEDNMKAESEDCIVDETSEKPINKNEIKSSVQSSDNLETETKAKVSIILDSTDVQPESKDENKMDTELISERSTVHGSGVVETDPRREVLSPQHSSNEPAVENQNVSELPSGEHISTILPSFSSVTDKSSEKSPDLVMEPATDVSSVPYALSENKENVMKPVPKPVHEENVSEMKITSKTDGHAKGTDSDSESKSPASEKELSESEETLNLNGKSSHKKLVRGTRQETNNPVKENKLEKSPENDSTTDRVVDKSQLQKVTSKEKSKTKSRKYSEESEEGEMKSESESKSVNSSDSSEHRRSRRKSRKCKRKVSRSRSSDSSRSRSRENSSVEKVVKIDNKENSKVAAGSVSKSHDGSSKQQKPKTETRKGKQNSRERKKRVSRSGSSNSSRSRSRDSSIEKAERSDSEGNSKVAAGSVSKSHDGSSKQQKPKTETRKGKQSSREGKKRVSRSGSSNSSRSRSRDSSIEKAERTDSEGNSKVDADSVSKSHDGSSKVEKSKSETRKGKRNSRERKKRTSRSVSSNSSRSRSRDSSIEKVKSEGNSKVDTDSVSKSHGDATMQGKSKLETIKGRQNSRVSKRKTSRSESSNSSRSRSRDSSVEKVERRDSEENSKIDASSFSKTHDDSNEQENSKPEIGDSKRGRQNLRKDKRKISRSGSSSSSRSRSRDNSSLEKVEKMETEENSKPCAGSVSKSHDDAVKKEEHKPETPQKRLKLKRDNVIVSDLPQATKKDTSEDKTPQIRKNSDAGVDETVEKNNAEATKQIEPQPVKYVSTRKIRISGRKLSETPEEEPKVKRGKWGSYSSSQKPSQAISISTDSLKNWFPDFKLLKNPDVISEVVEEMQAVSKENNPDNQTEKIDESKHISQNIEMKDEQIPEPVEQIDESEATNILFIQNLVRPFTLLQLKELLKETGNFIEEKFWIDKIKSKCVVTYSTVEEAIKTKSALNGTRWPSSNPKILSVEYSTEEDLQLHQSGSEPPKSLPPPPPVENPEPLEEHSLEDLRRKEREPQERRRDRSKPQPVREWDKNKLTQESPTRERVSRSIERSRSSDKKEKKDAKRRPNEDTPAKLLDDLFQKTKSSPCIYWLPLTEEQVAEREEARRLRRLEREKRIQQREQEEAENKAKAAQSRNRAREMESRRSSTRSRSPVSRRR